MGTLASGNSQSVPYLVARGDGAGPCLWINAAVHGDESQAAIVAAEFFGRLVSEELAGDVVVTPVANPPAFDQRRKHSPVDSVDLDQSFPGRADFLQTQRLAHTLFEEMRGPADVIVNLHTMGPMLDACNYAVYKSDPSGFSEDERLKLIALLDVRVACRMDLKGPGELPGNIEGALDYQMMELGKQAFMLEAGASGGVDRNAIDRAVNGLLALSAGLGVMRGYDYDQPRSICRATGRTHVTSNFAGFFHQDAVPGSLVEASQPLGRVIDVYGDVVEVVSLPDPVLVIGIRSDPVVHSGDRVAFVATEWDEVTLADQGSDS